MRMDTSEMSTFDSNAFDIVFERGVLHHLDLEAAYAEIARILKPGGKVICVEALGHNRLIHLYRRLTPQYRTAWEVKHILKREQIELARKYFQGVELMGTFHLASMLAVPFRKTRLFNPVLTTLEAVDRMILKTPWLKWQAWQEVFVLSGPKR